jgi:hypothetical protein
VAVGGGRVTSRAPATWRARLRDASRSCPVAAVVTLLVVAFNLGWRPTPKRKGRAPRLDQRQQVADGVDERPAVRGTGTRNGGEIRGSHGKPGNRERRDLSVGVDTECDLLSRCWRSRYMSVMSCSLAGRLVVPSDSSVAKTGDHQRPHMSFHPRHWTGSGNSPPRGCAV